MGYFDDKKNVDEYIKMAEGYDGRDLIEILKKQLPRESTVLELGMGPGIDLEILSESYKVTGSDFSRVFIDLYREKDTNMDLLVLDAVKIQSDRTFDCIYSNKVLHHLTRTDLDLSFSRQSEVVNTGGLIMHSFWHGSKEEFFQGLGFVYYEEEEIAQMIGSPFEVMEMERYTEMEKDDSFYLLARKAN